MTRPIAHRARTHRGRRMRGWRVVRLLQRSYGYSVDDTFRSIRGGWLLSKPMTSTAWWVSRGGRVRYGTLTNWHDVDVEDL